MSVTSEVQGSGLFDRSWYLNTYPDVKLVKISPIAHFVRIGMKIGRNPGPHFDTAYYLEQAPEAAVADIPPFLHYLRVGKAKGYSSEPSVPGVRQADGDVPLVEGRDLEPLDGCVGQGIAARVEWTQGRGGAGQDEVSVSSDSRDGLTCYRLRTGSGKGRARLRLTLPEDEGRVLGIRFLLRAVEGARAGVLVEPRIVAADLADRVLDVDDEAQTRGLRLGLGNWYEIAGAFVVPAGQPVLLLELPKHMELLLSGISAERFEAKLGDERTGGAGDEILPIRSFAARRIDDPAGWSRTAPVYAMSLVRAGGGLEGWAITGSGTLSCGSRAGGRREPLQLADVVAVAPGVEMACGVTLDCDAETMSVFPSDTAHQPLWIAPESRSAAGVATPEVVRILEARIDSFVLKLRGVARNPLFPGMPVRLRILQGGELVATLIARMPDDADLLGHPSQSFLFQLEASVPEHRLDAPLHIELVDAGPVAPVYVPVENCSNDKMNEARDDSQELPKPPAGTPVAGKVDRITETGIEGWAMYQNYPDVPVELVLLMDGKPFSYVKTAKYRHDVQNVFGGRGFVGFYFELPDNITALEPPVFEIRPIGTETPLLQDLETWNVPAGHIERATLPAPRSYVAPAITAAAAQRVSVVILNRNGAALLQDMFSSCDPADLSEEIEWIVVDHNSDDRSEEVCAAFRENGANIRFFRRKGNYSFSDSNNFGARQASGDVLIFANNDLIFAGRFGDRILQYLSDPSVGLVGVRLLDHIDAPDPRAPRIIQHLGVFFSGLPTREDWIRPFEARKCSETGAQEQATRAISVTGAFFAMRRADFETIGGFEEAYHYGLEDVDLSLKVHALLGKQTLCANDLEIVHHRGFSRKKDSNSGLRRRNNNEFFNSRWGRYIRRQVKQTLISDPGLWTGRRPVFAFFVADVGGATSAGEYYTSLEMGRALQRLIPCHVKYIPEQSWYNTKGIDVAIAMVNRFDHRKLKAVSPWTISVNWMRQWFDRWAEDPTVSGYDLLFASSQIAATYLEERIGRPVDVLPIASNPEVFGAGRMSDQLKSDYCFTGSRFGPPREIEFQLDPEAIDGVGKVFGHNWEGTPFEAISVGPIDYSKMPDVYASTRIVIDDANIATKPWGSCNSRVFDALAAGALLITNGAAGVQELFGDLVPTYDSRESLTETLNYWLSHEDERQARVRQLQEIVRTSQSYDTRAAVLLDKLTQEMPVRIAIKCPAPFGQRLQWGDFYFAESLAASLRKLGHVVRVDCREDWYTGFSNSDDVTLCLRGILAYKPRPHQKNIMWLISHPADVTVAEIESFDRVFVASEHHAELLRNLVHQPVDFLPQCTDITRFRFDPERVNQVPERNLYVGNSRGIFREPVQWSVQKSLSLDIYGGGWEPFLQNDPRHKGNLVPNDVLGDLYGASRLVICDHWADMRELGYVANRVFDVLAVGGRLLVDPVVGLESLVPSQYYDVFRNEDEFIALISGEDRVDLEQRKAAAEWVATYHSFDARAQTISAAVKSLLTQAELV